MTKSRLYKQIFTTGGSNFSTNIAAASNGVGLPTGTIFVNSTAGFPTSGTFSVATTTTVQTVTYTNLTGTSFTGCSGGTGLLYTGGLVNASGSISDGIWTTPAGVKWIILTGCGGGGGGGAGASCSGRAAVAFAGGGSGGMAAPTTTQILPVTPGVSYSVSIGEGGIGGTPNCVANIVNGGGQRPGNPGSDGSATVFGVASFTGGRGGREGMLISINTLTFPAGNDCSNNPLSGTSNPNPQSIQFVATVPTFSGTGYYQGTPHAVNRATNQYSLSGGGTSGGTSNNIYSYGGGGGQGAQGFDGYPFSTGGYNGFSGGGGGGGGGGENWDYNNTHDGAAGGSGGAGFVEVSWMA